MSHAASANTSPKLVFGSHLAPRQYWHVAVPAIRPALDVMKGALRG